MHDVQLWVKCWELFITSSLSFCLFWQRHVLHSKLSNSLHPINKNKCMTCVLFFQLQVCGQSPDTWSSTHLWWSCSGIRPSGPMDWSPSIDCAEALTLFLRGTTVTGIIPTLGSCQTAGKWVRLNINTALAKPHCICSFIVNEISNLHACLCAFLVGVNLL